MIEVSWIEIAEVVQTPLNYIQITDSAKSLHLHKLTIKLQQRREYI